MKLLMSIIVLVAGGLVLACSGDSSEPAPAATATSAAGEATGGSGPVTLEITAEDIAFDQESLSVPANTQVTVNFENNDTGVPHDFGVSLPDVEPTDTCEGPCSGSITFDSGEAGAYTFQCRVHPEMTGEFIVE